jgi:hypothetical protein
MTFQKWGRHFALIVFAALAVKPALAACGGPPTSSTGMGAVAPAFTVGSYNGNPGDTVYDTTNLTLAVCNGTSWVDLANASGSFVNLQATTPGTQQTGNMNVSGSGIFGTRVTTPLIYPSADSTTAIQFDKANGSTNVVDIDTTNGRVGIGTTVPGSTLQVNGTSAVGTNATMNFLEDFKVSVPHPGGIGTQVNLESFGYQYNSGVGNGFMGVLSAVTGSTGGAVGLGYLDFTLYSDSGHNNYTSIGTALSLAYGNTGVAGPYQVQLLAPSYVTTDGAGDTPQSGLKIIRPGPGFKHGSVTDFRPYSYNTGTVVADSRLDIWMNNASNQDYTADTYIMSWLANGNIGIGTTGPLDTLDVSGAAAIGAGYAGISAAPTNGLIVQGNVGIGTTSPNAKLDVNSNSIIIEQSNTPADNATCTAGTHWWDANYIYVCTASGTVKRAALSTF